MLDETERLLIKHCIVDERNEAILTYIKSNDGVKLCDLARALNLNKNICWTRLLRLEHYQLVTLERARRVLKAHTTELGASLC